MSKDSEGDHKEFDYCLSKSPLLDDDSFSEYNDKPGFENCSSISLLQCNDCSKIFTKKKNLATHILIHHNRQPKIILQKIDYKEPKNSNQFCTFDLEKRDGLKVKLKKTNPHRESIKLKLKLKRSNLSESFEVVDDSCQNSKQEDTDKVDLGIEPNETSLSENKLDLDKLNEIPEYDNCNKSNKNMSPEESFENVMIDPQNDFSENNYDLESNHNPLESQERPLMDSNEGDSGVGSDSANPSEREDQNVDDLHGDNSNYHDEENHDYDDQNEYAEQNNYENNGDRRNRNVHEDHESDILEATCRETIENLRKLGEQSRFISCRSTEINDNSGTTKRRDNNNEQVEEPADDDDDEEEEEENDQNSNGKNISKEFSSPIDMIEELKANNQISIVSKSRKSIEKPSSTQNMKNVETEILPLSGLSSAISLSRISDDNNKKQGDYVEDQSEEDAENENTTGSNLLRSFLLEHNRRNENEDVEQTLETEYVSLEKLAETVNTCKVCNEKFKDSAYLDAHKSKMGHYQCSIPECSGLTFSSSSEVSRHKKNFHTTSLPPGISLTAINRNSSQTSSPGLNSNSPKNRIDSPVTIQDSPQGSPVQNVHSPNPNSLPSHHQSHNSSNVSSPLHTQPSTYMSHQSSTYPPISLEELPAPVQQLAQQVQRMPLPQPQMHPMSSVPNSMMSGSSYYPPHPSRQPMYRIQPPMSYTHHMPPAGYPAYSTNPYPQMGMQAPMPQHIQPPMRYPAVMPNQRIPRMPQQQIPQVTRARMKRPVFPSSNPPHVVGPLSKQRRVDPLPDRNEDPDIHIISQQKRNDGMPVIQNVQGSAPIQTSSNPRTDSTIHLTDSITLSVRQPDNNTPAQVNAMVKSPSNASAVTNALAARGITVTSSGKSKSSEQSNNGAQQQQSNEKQSSNGLAALNLNSAISIVPTPKKSQEQSGQFAVPQAKQNKSQNNGVERPPRPPTVDLTQELPNGQDLLKKRSNRMLQSLTCQVCEKRFQNQEMLMQHMSTHRGSNKLIHRCNLCAAQYPTATALLTHKKTYHKEMDPSIQHTNVELALPVVDLKSPNTLSRLTSLGIQSYIPLSQLSAQTGGYFGLPIVSVDGARNPNSSNLGALGATSILSLGPLKHLSSR